MVNCGYMSLAFCSCSWITVMTLSGRTFFWLLLLCTSFLPGNADESSYIRGVPGKDYPNYSNIPQTSFRCSQQLHIPGLYADTETRCQVFHHCYEHRQESFLCPLGTVFNQPILACDYWYSVDCSAAPLYYGSNSPHQAIYEEKPEFAPIKKSPENLLDKMASLYEVNEGFSIPNDSGNEVDFLDNHSFSDRELIVQSKPVIKNRNFMETKDHYERHDIVLDELPEEYQYVQNNEDPEENIMRINFENSFEGSGQFSGESKEFEEEVLSQAGYLWPSSEKGDFDTQQFTIMQKEHVEEKTKPHVYSNYKDESKGSSVSGDTLAKRYSENNVNPYSRKSVRRRPVFTIIESEAETTQQLKEKASTTSIDSVDQGTTSSPIESSVFDFPDSSVTSYKAKRRRKPIVIDLDNSLQYNIDSVKHLDGGASVNYEVNPQSKVPGVSIAAQEIAVKLIPSESNRKRKPVGEYLFNQYNRENEEITESTTVSYATSPASNIHYEVTTYPTFKEFEISDEDFAVNFNRVNPTRKKNKIRILDLDNYVGIDDAEQEDTTLPILQFGDETRPIEEEVQDFEDNSSDTFEGTKEISEQEFMPEVSLKEDIFEMDPSYFITENDTEKPNTIIPDTLGILQETLNDEKGTSFQKSDVLDKGYISHINHNSSLETEKFVGDGHLDDNTDSVILKSLEGFGLSTYDDLQEEKYFTAEPISEISTSIPLEIQSTEDSASTFYLIPQSNFESDYDHSDNSKNSLRPIPVTLEGNHDGAQLASGTFDLPPPYHIFLEDTIRDETIVLPHSEDVEFQTIISDSYKSDTEIENFPNTELTESILHHNNKTSLSSKSQDTANNNYAHSGEVSTASDLLLDAELEDHLSHPNANLDSTAKLDVILTESKQTEDPALRDVASEQYSEIPRHLINETVDFDAMKERDKDVKDQTILLELNTNSPHPPKMVNTDILDRIALKNNEHKGNAELENIANFIDLSNDFSETSKEFDSDPSVTTKSILENSENPLFWNNINAFQNGAFNSDKKLSKNVDIKDLFQVIDGNQLKTTQKPIMNNAHSVLLPISKGGMENAKTRPLRNAKTLASPYQTGFNMEEFGSRYLAGFPSSVLNLKQSNIQNLFPYSGPAFEDGAFYARTGGLLESPKISKLISIGKNLLRSKKAKFRILSRYINSFNQ